MEHNTEELLSSTSTTIFMETIFYGKGQHWHLGYLGFLSQNVNFLLKQNEYFISERFLNLIFSLHKSSCMKEPRSVSPFLCLHSLTFAKAQTLKARERWAAQCMLILRSPTSSLGSYLLKEHQELRNSNSHDRLG